MVSRRPPVVGGHHRDFVHVVLVGVHRLFQVRQKSEGEHAVVDGKVAAVRALHRPADPVVPVLVGGTVGVNGGGGVFPNGELGAAPGGDDGGLVQVGHGNGQCVGQRSVGPSVGRPDDHLVDVVPVGISGPFVVGRDAEPQLAQGVDHEVAAVLACGAPTVYRGAGVLGVTGSVPGQHRGVGVVLGHGGGNRARHRDGGNLVDVGNGDGEVHPVPVAVGVGGHHGQLIHVVPIGVDRVSRSPAGWQRPERPGRCCRW